MARTGKRLVKGSVLDGKALEDTATEQTERNCEVNQWSGSCSGDDRKQSSRNKILGVDELAEFFNCSTEKIKRLARRGELPAFKFGKSWFMRERDLEVFLDRAAGSVLRPRRQP